MVRGREGETGKSGRRGNFNWIYHMRKESISIKGEKRGRDKETQNVHKNT